MSGINAFLFFMFFWLLILTVAFVIHWFKVERNLDLDKHSWSKASANMKDKLIGKK